MLENYIDKLKISLSKYIDQQDGGCVAVAVSGGADSIFLIHVAAQLSKDIIAVHINHQTREACSNEAIFVQKLCKELGVSCEVLTAEGLLLDMSNFEEEARSARYRLFQEAASKHHIRVIMTAHHQDDMIENAFIKLCRGSNRLFIPEIRSVDFGSELKIVRPMLGISKAEIMDYITNNNISYISDQSNLDSKYLRNFFRIEILPKLKEKISSLNTKIASAVFNSSQEEEFLRELADSAVERIFEKNVCAVDDFLQEHRVIQQRVLQNKIRRYFNKVLHNKHIAEILKSISDSESNSVLYKDTSSDCRIVKENGLIVFINQNVKINLEKINIIMDNKLNNNLELWNVSEECGLGLSYENSDDLYTRAFHPEDNIRWGNGHKLILSYLEDKKISKLLYPFVRVIVKNQIIIGILVGELVYISQEHRVSSKISGGLMFQNKQRIKEYYWNYVSE
ncbi:MAG: tRNA lysidine(34) synthetase TilS [Brevinemataceae bacterium]